MALRRVGIEPIRLLVEENGEKICLYVQGTWLVGNSALGFPDPNKRGAALKVWSIARSEKGKFVAYCREFLPDAAGTIEIAETHQELANQIPGCIFEQLEIALGLREEYHQPERPLDL